MGVIMSDNGGEFSLDEMREIVFIFNIWLCRNEFVLKWILWMCLCGNRYDVY